MKNARVAGEGFSIRDKSPSHSSNPDWSIHSSGRFSREHADDPGESPSPIAPVEVPYDGTENP